VNKADNLESNLSNSMKKVCRLLIHSIISVFERKGGRFQNTVKSIQTLGPTFVFAKTGVWLIQVKLTKIFYVGASFKAWFTQDSSLFKVRFRQVLQ
jgi:hypothetical protein